MRNGFVPWYHRSLCCEHTQCVWDLSRVRTYSNGPSESLLCMLPLYLMVTNKRNEFIYSAMFLTYLLKSGVSLGFKLGDRKIKSFRTMETCLKNGIYMSPAFRFTMVIRVKNLKYHKFCVGCTIIIRPAFYICTEKTQKRVKRYCTI